MIQGPTKTLAESMIQGPTKTLAESMIQGSTKTLAESMIQGPTKTLVKLPLAVLAVNLHEKTIKLLQAQLQKLQQNAVRNFQKSIETFFICFSFR
jgi:hypothetical protein